MRKCVLVSLALLFGCSTLFAQDDSGGGYFDAGNMAFEIAGSPFEGNGSSNGKLLSFGSFRARYAVTTTIIPRLGMNMSLDNHQVSPDVVVNNSMYEVAPGCEYHFRIEGGFRSYAALDGLFGQRFASLESTTQPSVNGAVYVPSSSLSEVDELRRGYMMYGAQIGFGADYHFSSNFYVGAEIGFRLVQYQYDDIEVDGELFQAGVQQNTAAINTMNSIRIGFKFL